MSKEVATSFRKTCVTTESRSFSVNTKGSTGILCKALIQTRALLSTERAYTAHCADENFSTSEGHLAWPTIYQLK